MVGACIISGYGINADEELEVALALAGADARRIHINDLICDPGVLDSQGILAFPGGFSFGDHLGSGLVFAALLRSHFAHSLHRFIERAVW